MTRAGAPRHPGGHRRRCATGWLPAPMLAALLVGWGCGRSGPPPAAEHRPLQLDGAVIAAEPDPLLHTKTYDAETVFHMAADAYRQGRPEAAQELYTKLLTELPDSRLATAASFNLGLVLESQQRYAAAVAEYRRITTQPERADRDRRTWIDAHFRLAVCQGKLGEWWRAVAAFDAVLDTTDLDDFDRLEALVGRGIALQEAEAAEDAEAAFAAALHLFREASHRGVFDDRGLAAEAALRMGEIAGARFAGVALAFPIDTLRQRLEQKCTQLLSAQRRYLRAMRYGDAHTVAVAGFRIGSLYEDLHETILSLETPEELTEEQAKVYREEVGRRVSVLVKKALMIYERALLVGRRAESTTAWVGRLEAAIERLRGIYLADAEAP